MDKFLSRIFANKALGVIFSVLVVVAAIGGYQALNRYFTVGVSAPRAAEGTLEMGCYDSDSGENYGTFGAVSLVTDPSQSGEDFCSPDAGPGGLFEYSCKNGQIDRTLHFCPDGCSKGACIKLPVATLTVLSPNGGEKWPLGSTQKIRWSDDGPGSYAVYVTDHAGSAYGLVGLTESMELEWVVGKLEDASLPAGSYYIQVIGQSGSGEADQGDAPFTISK